MGRFDQSVPHLVELAHGMGTFDRWSLRPVEVAHLVGIAARAHLVRIPARAEPQASRLGTYSR